MARHFDQLYRADSRLISGDFYQDLSPRSTTGHPFYDLRDWVPGSVRIDSIIFDSLMLRYDICNNKLVCNTLGITNANLPITLNLNRINRFCLGSKVFIPFPVPDQNGHVRFCELLTDGKISLVLLQSKQLKVPVGGNTSFNYENSASLKLLLNDEIIDYHGRKTLYRLFPELKEPVRTFIQSEKLNLRRKNTGNHSLLVNYCNSLLKTIEK